jgi:hypothetical protein
VSGTPKRADRQEALARVVGHLTMILPAVDEEAAAGLLGAALTDKGAPLHALDRHLAAYPDALEFGDPNCPAAVVRLAHVLHDAGHASIVPPGCAVCGKVTVDLQRCGPTGRLCRACGVRSDARRCGRCGRTGHIVARRPEGGICERCYAKDPLVIEACGRSGRLRKPAQRLEDGTALCQHCWSAPAHVCCSCGQLAPAHAIRDGSAICGRCNPKHRSQRVCGRCGRQRSIALRATGDHPDLCGTCYRGPVVVCSICGRVRPCHGVSGGAACCASCRPRPRRLCCRCGQTRPTQADWPIGSVCSTCYDAVLKHPGECGSCHAQQPLIAVDDAGIGICGPCVGIAVDYTCRACGQSGRLYADGQCARCVLGERLRDLLTGQDGKIPAQLTPLLDALVAVDRPRTVLQWLRQSPGARLLAKLAAEGRPVTHELLDEIPPSQRLHYIRQVLVHTGVLLERQEDLDRISPWLEQVLAGRPAHHAQLIRPFVHWFLLRRARRRAARRAYTAASGHYLRTRILIALDFLAWLDDRRAALQDIKQADVDLWLATGSTHRYAIRDFLSWAHTHALVGRLTVPNQPRQDPSQLMSEPERWTKLQHCLTDATLPLDVRAAGVLVLLFGLQPNRIRQLTSDHLGEHERRTYLTLDQHSLLLPPRVADLLRQFAAAPPIPSALARSHQRSQRRWLFPGLVPGRRARPARAWPARTRCWPTSRPAAHPGVGSSPPAAPAGPPAPARTPAVR